MEKMTQDETFQEGEVVVRENWLSGQSKKVLSGILVLLLAVALVYISWFFFISQSKNFDSAEILEGVIENENSTGKSEPFADLEGLLFLSLTSTSSEVPGIYKLNLANQTITEILNDGFVKYSSELSYDKSKIVYVAAPKGPSQIFIRDLVNKERSVLTHTDAFFKRLPRWSPDGTAVAFTGVPSKLSEADHSNPNNWAIWISNLGEKEETQFLSLGTDPHWSPDGKDLFFLGQDGFYLYNLADATSTKVLPAGRNSTRTYVSTDISKNGKWLAWIDPYSERMRIFKIESWDPFELSLKKEIDANDMILYSPTFSPNGKYVAFFKIATVDEEPSKTSIVVHHIATGSQKELLVLDNRDYNLDLSRILISDWR